MDTTIIGVLVGVVLLAIALIVLLVCCCRCRKKKRDIPLDSVDSRRDDTLDLHGYTAAGAKAEFESFLKRDRSVLPDSRRLSTNQRRPDASKSDGNRKRESFDNNGFVEVHAKTAPVESCYREDRSVLPNSGGKPSSTNERRPVISVPRESAVDRIPVGDTLDFHGISAGDAIPHLEFFLKEAPLHYNRVYLITGRGLHSEDGIPVIRNMVQKYLKEHNYRYTWMNKGGKVCIYL